jgi:hypothetical protein
MVRVPLDVTFSGFSWKYGYVHYLLIRESRGLSGSILMVDLPAIINIYTLQPAIPSAGGTVTTPSPLHYPMEVTEY